MNLLKLPESQNILRHSSCASIVRILLIAIFYLHLGRLLMNIKARLVHPASLICFGNTLQKVSGGQKDVGVRSPPYK